MTPLMQRLLRRINVTGPIPFHEYWAMCLFDPDHGYYTTRVPIGAQGDFTTAPEISQMFGELLAAWWLATVRQNSLNDIHLVEIGPGRGTLMADMLRTLGKLDPTLKASLPVHMVEVSPRLTTMQQERLKDCGFDVQWHRDLTTLRDAPLGIIANELFDAIPVRQLVKQDGLWSELAVTDQSDIGLAHVTLPVSVDPSTLPGGHADQPNGAVFEYAPAREGFMAELAVRVAQHSGFGLFIDYGHVQTTFGDTIQAIKDHAYANPLDNPGEADLTSHVDFEALANIAKTSGLSMPAMLTQGEFLTRLGIRERAARLGQLHPDRRDTIETACDRLIGNDEMGRLFKVMPAASPNIALPVFD